MSDGSADLQAAPTDPLIVVATARPDVGLVDVRESLNRCVVMDQ